MTAPGSTRDAAGEEVAVDEDGTSRCKPSGGVTPLGVPGEVVVGDATVTEEGIAIGLIRTAPTDARGGAAGTLAAVALLPPDGSSVRIVDIGPTSPDAPTPRLAWRGDSSELIAATTTAEDGLSVEQVSADGASKQLFRSSESRDPLSPFDLAVSGARGVVVWEATSRGYGRSPRGVIRAAAFEGSSRNGPARDLSPLTSDASDPRVVAWSSGYFAVWDASPVEATPAGPVDASAAEATSEALVARWLEGVILDAWGVPLGPPMQLTAPAVSSVASFDVEADPFDKAAALIVARVESAPGRPGREVSLEALRLRANGASPSPELMTRSPEADPVGMSAPDLLPGSALWLDWSGPDDQLFMMPLVPLVPGGALAGARPKAERAFGDARPVASLANGKLLAIAAGGEASSRLFECAR